MFFLSFQQQEDGVKMHLLAQLIQYFSVSYQNATLHGEITNLATRDGLTKLHNVRYFHERIAAEFNRMERLKHPLGLIFLDIDNFKQYNASFSQAAGDEALKVLSKLLSAYVRDSDLVARDDGKDKFVLILPYTEGENAKIPLERYIEAVSRYRFDDKNPNVHLTVSCGIATFPSDANSEQEILDKAELSLRRAKVLGKNKIFTYPAAVQPMV